VTGLPSIETFKECCCLIRRENFQGVYALKPFLHANEFTLWKTSKQQIRKKRINKSGAAGTPDAIVTLNNAPEKLLTLPLVTTAVTGQR